MGQDYIPLGLKVITCNHVVTPSGGKNTMVSCKSTGLIYKAQMIQTIGIFLCILHV